MSRAYVRKTEGERREPGGLERAVLLLVIDGFRTNFEIAAFLETSTENVQNALGRLGYAGYVYRDDGHVPFRWLPTPTGKNRYKDDAEWL